MEAFKATRLAMKFAECHISDKSYVENNTPLGMMTACMEEAGEYIAAFGKYKRTLGEGPITPVSEEDALLNLKKELADVVSTGILLAEKMGWLDDILDIHKAKSQMCLDRIVEKQNTENEGEA